MKHINLAEVVPCSKITTTLIDSMMHITHATGVDVSVHGDTVFVKVDGVNVFGVQLGDTPGNSITVNASLYKK